MKRLLGLTSLSLAAVFMVTSLADGQRALVRAEPQEVRSSTSPERDRTLPATFTTTGRVVPPRYCAPGDTPANGSDCVGLICAPGVTDPAYCEGTKGCPPGVTDPAYCAGSTCPPGVTNPAYCVPPPPDLLCTGNMTVIFRNGIFLLSVRNVELRSDCTYRSQVTFRSRRLRRATLRVSARFEGNDFLLPKSAAVDTVRIG